MYTSYSICHFVGPQSAVYNVTVKRTEDPDIDIDVGINFKITFDVCKTVLKINLFLKFCICMYLFIHVCTYLM